MTRRHTSRLRLLLATLVAANAISMSALAAPISETVGRLEVNWSTLRIRFYGEAKSSDLRNGDGLRGIEKRAWQDGLNYAADAVRNLHVSANEGFVSNPEKLAQEAKEAAKQVSNSTFSFNTTYFGDGTVRVHLENSLPKAIDTNAIRFRQKEALDPMTQQFTGIVFDVAASMKPRPTYRVVDESGAVLFDVKDMAAEAYRKNLMGRWFQNATPQELHDSVGQAPIHVPAVLASEDGVLQVTRTDWERLSGNRSLLVNGLIALSLP